MQGIEDALDAARDFTDGIDVLDADQPLTGGVTGVQITRNRGYQRSEMEMSGGRGGKAAAVERRWVAG
jgi:hypothetical protein